MNTTPVPPLRLMLSLIIPVKAFAPLFDRDHHDNVPAAVDVAVNVPLDAVNELPVVVHVMPVNVTMLPASGVVKFSVGVEGYGTVLG